MKTTLKLPFALSMALFITFSCKKSNESSSDNIDPNPVITTIRQGHLFESAANHISKAILMSIYQVGK